MFNWYTDRYHPHSFVPYIVNLGRTNVIGVEINHAEGFNERTGGQNATFYNTQGKNHNPTPGQMSVASSLYIPESWADPANGSRRTDIWIEMDPANTDYVIMGFTNYGGPPRYRAWNNNTGWVDLATPVVYDDWTDFRMDFTGTDYNHFIDNVLVYTMPSSPGDVAFLDIKIEAYNFTEDASLAGAVAGNPLGDYTAFWTNPFPLPDDPPLTPCCHH